MGSQPSHFSSNDFRSPRDWHLNDLADQDLPTSYRQAKYHPDHNPRCIPHLRQTLYRNPQEVNAQGAILRDDLHWPRLLSERNRWIEYVQRMADARNPTTLQPPSKDFQNIRAPSQLRLARHVTTMFDLLYHAGWHLLPELDFYLLQGPSSNGTPTNWSHILDHRHFAMLQGFCERVSDLEREQASRQEEQPRPLRQGFTWLPDFIHSIKDAANSMAAALLWADDRGKNLSDAIRAALDDIPEMSRLLLVLLERNHLFQMIMIDAHIFNCRYDKRIKFVRPRTLSALHDVCRPAHGQRSDYELPLLDFFRDEFYCRALPTLQRWQSRLRNLWDYKFLVDWNWHRPWNQLYVMIHPDMHISDETVKKFYRWANDNGFFTQKFFDVHPTRPDQFESDDMCPICQECFLESNGNITAGVLIMELNCGHYFHVRCIMQERDQPHKHLNRCPTCRAEAPLEDMLNYQPQRKDRTHEDPRDRQYDTWAFSECTGHVQTGGRLLQQGEDEQDAFWRLHLEATIHGFIRSRLPEQSTQLAHHWEQAFG